VSAYPAPWPLVPFSYLAPPLQAYIPPHLLPKKLIVHDPWNVLAVSESMYESETEETDSPTKNAFDWTKTPDIIHTYSLQLSPGVEEHSRADADKVKKENAEGTEGFFLVPPETPGVIEAPIFIIHPPAPEPDVIAEAHLYLSPAHVSGHGNHSVTYKAEWEVPRSMLISPSLCFDCVAEDVEAILKEEDGEDGSKKDARWRQKTSVVKKVEEATGPIQFKVEGGNGRLDDLANTYHDGPGVRFEFEGPVRPIHTRIPWRSPEECSAACAHNPRQQPHPATARVRVVAKLSLQHDKHLAAEANNYQKFPKHLFQHWNGYNIIPPLHDPTPVGAVVPQFYGLYVPEASQSQDYLSPIMLLEDCGLPVNPDGLDIDDKYVFFFLFSPPATYLYLMLPFQN
jgi:hypothetical protein